MSTKMKRFMLTVPPEIVLRVEKLKKTDFYNKPYAEMYRQILKVGLDAAKTTASEKK